MHVFSSARELPDAGALITALHASSQSTHACMACPWSSCSQQHCRQVTEHALAWKASPPLLHSSQSTHACMACPWSSCSQKHCQQFRSKSIRLLGKHHHHCQIQRTCPSSHHEGCGAGLRTHMSTHTHAPQWTHSHAHARMHFAYDYLWCMSACKVRMRTPRQHLGSTTIPASSALAVLSIATPASKPQHAANKGHGHIARREGASQHLQAREAGTPHHEVQQSALHMGGAGIQLTELGCVSTAAGLPYLHCMCNCRVLCCLCPAKERL